MKQLDTKCKFCGMALRIEIADEYDEIGDPFKLLPLASCNRCADARYRQHVLVDKLVAVCATLLCHPEADEKAKLRQGLVNLTKSYLRQIADILRVGELAWDESIVDALMERPRELGDVINRLWGIGKEASRQKKLL